ncbi:MAG TPA: hypothetical protein VFG31_05220 [Conexibacter sp.]|nr:hypothetical protein [Conexibacter sp.]
MRRLANQSRDDAYSSRRDYQRFEDAQGLWLSAAGPQPFTMAFAVPTSDRDELVAFGGFLAPGASMPVTVSLCGPRTTVERTFKFRAGWNRFGLALRTSEPVRASLQWSEPHPFSMWGIVGGPVILPDHISALRVPDEALLKDHLVPETFYFAHEGAVTLDILTDASSHFTTSAGAPITLKKCSYCGRRLPVDPNRLGSLSFHKHNAKLTRHQNECRVCKKWRINDTLNELRTKDQLHESSVITRERKIFLRDPEILQSIKQRTGAGLKSQVWHRFGKRCFYCKRPLSLEEMQLDHTRPLAYLWPIDEHATSLCAAHNNQKKDKFPIDFYSDAQLAELSAICGLSLDQLRAKEVNPAELRRILASLPTFSREWDSRHFAATARKIAELRPDVDLYAQLRDRDPEAHRSLCDQLAERPLPADFEMTNEA